MDAAASVIAVVQITEQVLTLCYKYLKGFKNSHSDIQRLVNELQDLGSILQGAKELLSGPHQSILKTSQKLRHSLEACASEIKKLETRLAAQFNGVRHRLVGRLKWPLESKEVDVVVHNFHRHRDNVSAALTIDQAAVVLDGFKRIEELQRLEILEWISLIQYGKHHISVTETRTENTCQWLLETEKYQQWWRGGSGILWLQGSPGTGKTFLTSQVIDDVIANHDDSCKEGIAFFYCNRNDDERRQPLSVLQSYVRQLAIPVGIPGKLRSALQSLWQESRLKGKGLDFETCKNQLLQSINIYDKTTLILDALDECDHQSRFRLVEAIEFLFKNATKPFRVFISSRPDGDIRERFHALPNIEIQATNNEDDIRKFVSSEIVRHRRWNKISKQLREEVMETLLVGSQGMFQWVFLQIRQLLDLQTENAIRDRLGKIPQGLTAAYDEIYNKISSGNGLEKAIADRAFMWVACAMEPLETDTLLDAIRFNPDDIAHPTEEIDENLLLDLCKNLLVLDSQQKVWKFSHLSVTEYFEDNHWELWQAHCHAAKVSLGLLLQTYRDPVYIDARNPFIWGNFDIRDTNKFSSFHKYFQRNWIFHVQKQGEHEQDPLLSCRLMEFLGSPSEASQEFRMWSKDTAHIGSIQLAHLDCSERTIYFVCRYSLFSSLSDWWLKNDLPLFNKTRSGDTPLMLAAEAGCLPICELIVQRGEDVNRQGGLNGTALVAALHGGNMAIVEFLVQNGTDINLQVQDRYHGSALVAAATTGKKEFVKYLIENGADINMVLRFGRHGSALAAAAEFGHGDTVKFLVENGADINMVLQCGLYGSALAAATADGHEDIVKFLVENGADINIVLQCGRYGSALAAATADGYEDIVKFLVENGADINMVLQCGDYGSALAAAAAYGHGDAVKFLVENGADINMVLQCGDYGSALAAAAADGYEDTVKFLVENGADINMVLQCGRYGSALAAAAADGYEDTVEFLVENGADINMVLQCGLYGSALAAAADDRYGDTVKFLVENGADINMVLQCGDYGSALAAAAAYEQGDTVKFLVENGADINMVLQCGDYGSALVATMLSPSLSIFLYVFERGAVVDLLLQTGNFGSALAAAAHFGLEKIVQSLIKAGADVNLVLKTGLYKTAYDAAMEEVPSGEKLRFGYCINDEELRQDKARVAELLRKLKEEEQGTSEARVLELE